MKAYKLEILIVDHDQCGADEIKSVIENQRYPNWCISPNVMSITERDIGEWHDDHPLNKYGTMARHYTDLFAPGGEKE